jgi:FMN-dependent oxidoreductase (nitrilotriacetate monooxygenase family)
MSAVAKQIRLNLNLQTAGRHDAAWKTQEDTDHLASDAEWYVRVAQLAEKGKFDAIFLADGHGSLGSESVRHPWRGLDPTVLLTAIAQKTERIGLVSTVHAIYGHPFSVARSIASLDHVSKGRAAWNIITSQNAPTLEALGVQEVLDRDVRYRKAEEFVQIVTGLWDSLPQSAIVDDRERDLYIDTAQTLPVDYNGEFYTSKAVLPLPGGYSGRPVLFQAGASDDSRAFGAKWADALFTSQRTKELGQSFSAQVKGLASSYGRDPDKLVVLPGLFAILGATESDARRRKDQLDALLDAEYLKDKLADQLGLPVSDLVLDAELPYDKLAAFDAGNTLQARQREQLVTEARTRHLTVRQLLFNNLSGGQRMIVGTPEQVADDIIEWVDSGASDGFNINIDVQTEGLEQFIDGVVAELQRRGRFRHDYEYETFRENLGVA